MLIREVEAPDGYYVGANEFEVDLEYRGGEIESYHVDLTAYNERQRYQMVLTKNIEGNEVMPIPDAWRDVTFGVFTEGPVLNASGEELLPGDTLVDVLQLDDQCQAHTDTDWWVGAKLYARELTTAEGYELNRTKYPFAFDYQGQDIPLLKVDLNELHGPIENKVIRGDLYLHKFSSLNGRDIAGAGFTVWSWKDAEHTQKEWYAYIETNELGSAELHDIPYSRYGYYIAETKVPAHFYGLENGWDFMVSEQGQVLTYDIKNTAKIGAISAWINDSEGSDRVSGNLLGGGWILTGETGRSIENMLGCTAAAVLLLVVTRKRKGH